MRVHEDERAWRYCDLFFGLPGDVNLFVLRPGQISAWHRHKLQDDQFVVVLGDVRFGVCHDGKESEYAVMSGLDRMPNNRTIIERTIWHGYENIGSHDAILLMYLSHKYEDGWDEERRTLEEMPWNP